jgi:hypothetical protein
MFDLLDPEGRGVMFCDSKGDLLNRVPSEVSDVVRALFARLGQGSSVTRSQFVEGMKDLYQRELDMLQRQKVQAFHRDQPRPQQAKKVATRKDLYILLHQDAEERTRRRTSERQQRQEELTAKEMKDCTFKPALTVLH